MRRINTLAAHPWQYNRVFFPQIKKELHSATL
jgi:hypothetical protein